MLREQDGSWALCDFGHALSLASCRSGQHCAGTVCTQCYRPVELLCVPKGARVRFAGEVDVWALGISLLEMCTPGRGSHVFPQEFFEEHGQPIEEAVLFGQWTGLLQRFAPKRLNKFFVTALAWEAGQRTSAAELIFQLQVQQARTAGAE